MTETPEQAPTKRKVIVADDEETIATTLAIIVNRPVSRLALCFAENK
jgi:hypothetical protein